MISLQLGFKTCQLERWIYKNHSLNPDISFCNKNQKLILCVLLPFPKYWIKILPFLTCYYLLLLHLWLDFLELPSALNQSSLAGFLKQNGFLHVAAKDKFKPMRIKPLFTTTQQPPSRQFQERTPDPMSHSRFNLEAHTYVQGKLKGESSSLSKSLGAFFEYPFNTVEL